VEIEAAIVKSDASQVIAAVVSNSPGYFGESLGDSLMRGLVIVNTDEHSIPIKIGMSANTEFIKLRANALALKDDSTQSEVAVIYTQDMCSSSCSTVRILLRVFNTATGAREASIPMND